MGVGIQTLRPDRSGSDSDHQCASEGCRFMRNVRSAHESFSLRHQGKTGTWCLVILEVPSPHSRKPPSHIDKAPNGPNGWFRGLNRFKPDLS